MLHNKPELPFFAKLVCATLFGLKTEIQPLHKRLTHQLGFSATNKHSYLTRMHTVTTKVTIYLILCWVFHFTTQEHSFTFGFPWWGTEHVHKSGQKVQRKG